MTANMLAWMTVYSVMSASHGWLSQKSPVSSPQDSQSRGDLTHIPFLPLSDSQHTAHFICSSTHTHRLSSTGQLGVQQAGRGDLGGGGSEAMLHFLEKLSAFASIDWIIVWVFTEETTGPF